MTELTKLPLAALALALAASAVQAEPLPLQRGVSVHEWLNWSPVNEDRSYKWPPYIGEDQWLGGYRPLADWPEGDVFQTIAALGFDFVRLSVDPGPLASTEGARQAEALDVIAAAITRINDAGLLVVLDLHGVNQVPQYGMDMVEGGADSAGVTQYLAMLGPVATRLAAIGTDKVALEPYNEPAYYPCDGSGTEDWQQIMTRSVEAIRAASADLTIVATGACGGSVAGLTDLDPQFDDPNLLYSFHMYEPHDFTHQRSESEDGWLSGLPWPADTGTEQAVLDHLRARMTEAGVAPGEQDKALAGMRSSISDYFAKNWGLPQLEARFDAVTAWADSHGIETSRLFMGEFGAILMPSDGKMGAFNTDRLRYIEAVRLEAEARGMRWSIWEWSNPFGMSVILPEGPAVPDTQLLRALGLGS